MNKKVLLKRVKDDKGNYKPLSPWEQDVVWEGIPREPDDRPIIVPEEYRYLFEQLPISRFI